MTQNMNEVLNQATKKIAGIIQKTMAKGQDRYRKSGGGLAINELETLIKESELD